MKWHCPICRQPTDSAIDREFPFCSERCTARDLGAWASEQYTVSEPAWDESERETPPAEEREDNS